MRRRQERRGAECGQGHRPGVISGGSVHGGVHNAAGRVAWIPIPSGGTDDDAALPLGQLLTADGMISDYRRFGGTAPMDGALAVFLADAAGDDAATRAIQQFAGRLGWLIAAIVAVLDPELVVIGGGVSRAYAAPRRWRRRPPGIDRRDAAAGGRLESWPGGGRDWGARCRLDLADAWLQEQLGA